MEAGWLPLNHDAVMRLGWKLWEPNEEPAIWGWFICL